MKEALKDVATTAVAMLAVLAMLLIFGRPLVNWLVSRNLARAHLVSVAEGDLALYRHCLVERGGSCSGGADTVLPNAAAAADRVAPVPHGLGEHAAAAVSRLPEGHPARLAAGVLGHPVVRDLLHLHDHLRGHPPARSAGFRVESDGPRGGSSTAHLQLSLRQIEDLVDQLHRSLRANGWKTLRDHLGAAVPPGSGAVDDSDGHQRLLQDHRRLVFIGSYLEAYFRDGRIVAVDLTIDPTKARADLAAELSRHTPVLCAAYGEGGAADCSALASAIYGRASRVGADRQLLKVSQRGFVSRDGGYTAQVPTFAIDVAPLEAGSRLTFGDGGKIDYTAVGNQLVRVLLEAIFDAHEGLPAVDNATGRQLGAWSLPAFDPSQGPVDTEAFDAMTKVDHQLVAATGASLNRVIRGLGPASLNNEALEELVTTLITTTVLKASQKATWCWYACRLDRELEAAERQVRAGEARLEGLPRTLFHREVEHLKLRLTIGS